jgi:tetratricopeptide (TPR) repeat protein
MITIYTDEGQIAAIAAIIEQEQRLGELVAVQDYLQQRPVSSGFCLIVRGAGIVSPIDWHNVQPPYLLPERLPFAPAVLLGLIFAKLGNYEKAHHYLAQQYPVLWLELRFIHCLQHGIPVKPEELVSEYSEFEEYRLMHNQALVRHYAAAEADFDLGQALYFYQEALDSAPNDEYRAFTARQYATLLTDLGQLDTAERELRAAIEYALSDDARLELKNALVAVGMKKLTVPYDQELLAQLKDLLWEVVQAYEQQARWPELGLALIDAAHIANISASFAEALGYISRAVEIFRREEMPELLANAHFRRGTLLYTWAQNGNPQFYRGALESYQEALKVFTREDAPEVFADIHHHLGVIYSEIPDEAKKKSIWAGVSAASFQEALQFYGREDYPYEYAMICNSYGNALTKYPAAVHSDNYEKALYYYQEALDIRSAEVYPFERAITLLNYIEACWYVGNAEDAFNQARYEDMQAKAQEVEKLVADPQLLAEAEQHLLKLAELKQAYASTR